MKFAFDTSKHGNINDNAVRDLPVGKNNYKIEKVEVVAVKADKSGKRKQICISLQHHAGQKYSHFLEITPKDLGSSATKEKKDGEVMRARIAADTFNALVQAADFKGVLTVPKFKLLLGKVVGIETTSTKVGENTYVNIRAIGAAFDIADTSEEEEVDEEEVDEEEPNEFDSDEEESDEEEVDENESDEEREEREAEEALEAKKAAALKKKKALALKKKKAAEAKAAAEAEESDEDEDEDEDEDDDEPW